MNETEGPTAQLEIRSAAINNAADECEKYSGISWVMNVPSNQMQNKIHEQEGRQTLKYMHWVVSIYKYHSFWWRQNRQEQLKLFNKSQWIIIVDVEEHEFVLPPSLTSS